MNTHYILYNPFAGDGSCKNDAECLQCVCDSSELVNIANIANYQTFLDSLDPDDILVIIGGDGTLNRFANDTDGIEVSQQILYLPAGTGNDFAKDIGKDGRHNPFEIGPYLKELPSVEVKGKRYRFINGVGFGIDGYCCQVGDRQKKIPGKKTNYTGIAIKGLLFHFQHRNAKVTVDGKAYAYQKVWIAPTMHGRFYGGGMIPAPRQDRGSGKLSVMLFHGAGRLRTLCVFPSIFKGKHIKHTKMVAIHTGQVITVEFDRPTPLQIDGETILDVTQYTACAAGYNGARKFAKNQKEKTEC